MKLLQYVCYSYSYIYVKNKSIFFYNFKLKFFKIMTWEHFVGQNYISKIRENYEEHTLSQVWEKAIFFVEMYNTRRDRRRKHEAAPPFAKARTRENVMKTPATASAMTVRRADPKPRVILPFRFLPWEATVCFEARTRALRVGSARRCCNARKMHDRYLAHHY